MIFHLKKTNKDVQTDPNLIEKELKTCLNLRKETNKKKQNNKEQNKGKQVNEEQVDKEQNKNEEQVDKEQNKNKQVKQVKTEQNKDIQDKEEQDKEDNFLEIRKQRSRYYLWKLYKEYEQMRLNQRYRMINFIVNIIISLASIVLGFFFWAIDHDPNIRNVIDFGKISLSFGGLGIIINTFTRYKFLFKT
ncbi:33418_t:CDS:2 [Gigaspora margarita]|uniref:33418_t:CDS:1 n=1 Tax=Gigaspora margarita TaxID=4874 RepID=A0ABM8W1L5_GIGMA|nr:33418_t:CDS:2 [Gigaspora margarita]